MDLIITLATDFTLGAGATTYLVARRDLRTAPAVAISVTAALATGTGFLFTVYLAVLAYLGALTVWLLARRFLPNRRLALATGAGALGIALTGSVLVMGYALSTM